MTRELTHPLPRSWWLKRPSYFRFMIRELTSVAVFAYAPLLIWALWSAADAGTFSVFYDFLRGPLSVWLHVVVLVLAFYHTGTWIALTPKVMVLWREDEQIGPNLIVGTTGMLFVLVSAGVVWLVLG